MHGRTHIRALSEKLLGGRAALSVHLAEGSVQHYHRLNRQHVHQQIKPLPHVTQTPCHLHQAHVLTSVHPIGRPCSCPIAQRAALQTENKRHRSELCLGLRMTLKLCAWHLFLTGKAGPPNGSCMPGIVKSWTGETPVNYMMCMQLYT